ncbi:MAG: TlpA family protein disulfide reductase [Oscillospiraceae bacterium]|nr:TlpA family protein disulfide reductase [Oscillospiraceae bacterium]
MKMKVLKSLLLSGCMLAASFSVTSCAYMETEESESAVSIVPGNAAPDFTVDLNGGGSFTLSDAKGKVVLINFWATWCGPCCEEMPAFERINGEFSDKVQIVAINSSDSQTTVKQFVKENGYSFPIAYDPDYKVGALYPTSGIPYTIVVNPDGIISNTFLGARSATEQYAIYKQAIEDALDEV